MIRAIVGRFADINLLHYYNIQSINERVNVDFIRVKRERESLLCTFVSACSKICEG